MTKHIAYTPKILIVDDRRANLIAMEKMLKPLGAELVCASSGNEALTLALSQKHFALCLLDVMMPGMDGFETAELLRQNKTTEFTPIIFITAIGKEEQHIFKGYGSGAVDYLLKPIDPKILRSKVKVFLDLEKHRWELKQSEETAMALLNAPLDTAILVNCDGTILALNRTAANRLDRAQEHLIGLSFFDLLPKELLATRKEKIEVAIRSAQPVRFEDRLNETIYNNHIYPVIGNDGAVSRLAIFGADITKRKQEERLLVRMASYDQLTGLANRAMFLSVEPRAMARAKRHGRTMAVLYIDLDRFKEVNDTLGHDVGDKLLQAVAKRLEDNVRSSDLISRLGGDEFGVILDEVNKPEEASQVADIILTQLAKPFLIDGQEITISSSIGIATYSGGHEQADEINKAADTAMYYAKELGRNNYQFYSRKLQQLSDERSRLRRDLGQALKREELAMVYQPQFEVASGRLFSFEALLRWHHKELGYISPATFIPLAEGSRVINPIGQWVLQKACREYSKINGIEYGMPPLSVSVNVSIRQLEQENFCESVEQVLEAENIAPNNLEIELTESIIMHEPQKAIEILTSLHNLGVRIALDDFGAGYSSLTYLRKLPIDTLKLDLSLIHDIGMVRETEGIITAMISLAHNLGIKVVAEGVETKPQVNFLLEHQCDYLQGYYFSPPLDVQEAIRFLKKHDEWCFDPHLV